MNSKIKAKLTGHQSARWTSFFNFSRDRFISYWLKYLIDHQANLDLLETEENNIKSAWLHAAKQQNEIGLLQAMDPFYQFYRMRGRINDGQKLFAYTLSFYENKEANYFNSTPTNQKLVGRLLTHQAWFYQNLGQYELAEELIQQASPLLYQFNDTKYIAFLLSIKGSVQSYGYGNLRQARGLHFRAFTLYQVLDDQWGMANTLNNLGATNVDLGNYQMAARLLENATTICQQNNYQELLAQSISNLGVAYEGLGQLSKATEKHQTCYEVYQQIKNKLGMAISLANQGQIALRQDRFIDARNFCLKQLILSREIDNKYLQVGGLADLGNAYYMLAHYKLAWETLQQGLNIATKINSTPSTIQVIAQIARLLYHLGMQELSFSLLSVIQSNPFPNRHLGNPTNLYDILVTELHPNVISTLQNEWQDKTLDDAVATIHRIHESDLKMLR